MDEKYLMKKVKERLTHWESLGIVLHWDRLNSGKIKTAYNYFIQLCKPGTADFIVFVAKDGLCWVLFFETKNSTDGLARDTQIEFSMLWSSVHNIVYEFITSPDQVDAAIEKITGHYTDKINSMEL